jgi:hypothetical protein
VKVASRLWDDAAFLLDAETRARASGERFCEGRLRAAYLRFLEDVVAGRAPRDDGAPEAGETSPGEAPLEPAPRSSEPHTRAPPMRASPIYPLRFGRRARA